MDNQDDWPSLPLRTADEMDTFTADEWPTVADDWLAGFTRHPSGSWSIEPQARKRLDAMIEEAQAGNKAAQRRAAMLAGDLMQAHKDMPPALHSYIAGALFRFGREDCTWNQALAPFGRMPPAITASRKVAHDYSLVYWIDHAREQGLATSTPEGDPGPAFDQVALTLGASPATIRDRYYRVRESIYRKFKMKAKIRESRKNCENS